MPTSREWVDLDRQVSKKLTRIQGATERRILREYAVALKEVRNEMGRLYTKLKNPDGLLTLAEMTRYNRLNSLDKQIAGIMDSHYKIVVKELRRIPPDMYNESFFRYAWAFDQNSGVNLTWGTIPPEVIEEISSNPLDLISHGELRVTERNRIRRAISQGLLQGKSFPQMMTGVRAAMGNNASQAMRIARTEGQRSQNAATDTIYGKATDQGIEGGVIWDATLDDRTRQTHRDKDGETRAEDGLFAPLGGVRVPHPVHPALPAGEAINCRCRNRFQVEGYEPQLRRTRDQGVIPYTTFDNWKGNLNARGKFIGKNPSPSAFGGAAAASTGSAILDSAFQAGVRANTLMRSAFANAPQDLIRKLGDQTPMKNITFGKTKHSHYLGTREGEINFSDVDKGLDVAVHEYGHHIEKGLTRNNTDFVVRIHEIMNEENRRMRRTSAAGKQLFDDITEEIKDRRIFIKPNGFMDIDKTAPPPDRFLNDYFGAITKNRIGYGHSNDYYKGGISVSGISTMQMTEAWANMTTAYARVDRTAWEAMEKFTPKLTGAFKEWLKTRV